MIIERDMARGFAARLATLFAANVTSFKFRPEVNARIDAQKTGRTQVRSYSEKAHCSNGICGTK